jgi:uncharacterized protein (TIGR02246 family)
MALRLVVCAALLSALVARASDPTDRVAPESLADRFVQAWNTHEASSFENLFTPNAYFVPTVNSTLDGRDNILADFGKAHTGWAKATTMGIHSGSVSARSVHPDVAVVIFHVGFRQTDGTLTTPGNAVLLVAVKQSDGWQIAAGQVAKPGATAKPN